MLQRWDLGFLLDRSENFYMSDDLIKLSFSIRRIEIMKLNAKNYVQNLSQCPISRGPKLDQNADKMREILPKIS